jgi:hypothetical protein
MNRSRRACASSVVAKGCTLVVGRGPPVFACARPSRSLRNDRARRPADANGAMSHVGSRVFASHRGATGSRGKRSGDGEAADGTRERESPPLRACPSPPRTGASPPFPERIFALSRQRAHANQLCRRLALASFLRPSRRVPVRPGLVERSVPCPSGSIARNATRGKGARRTARGRTDERRATPSCVFLASDHSPT